MSVIAEYQSLVKKTTDVNLGGKKLLLPAKKLFLLAKTIFATPFPVFFPRKKNGFFHQLAKTCQPWNGVDEICFCEAIGHVVKRH